MVQLNLACVDSAWRTCRHRRAVYPTANIDKW